MSVNVPGERGACTCARVAEGAVAHTTECVSAYWHGNSQPEPLHEVACPECGTTIRARMADQPGGDLRAILCDALGQMFVSNNERDAFLARLAPAVQAYVDSQVAAARADVVRLEDQRDSVLGIALRWRTEAAVAAASGQDDYTIYADGAGCMILRALGVKADRG